MIDGELSNMLKGESEKLAACVHCGLCLSSCPTYVELGDENDSPRGRLYLMRAVAEDRLAIGDAFKRHIDQCLGCRACETVCPSGVRYGHLLERARAEIVGRSGNGRTVLDRMLRLLLGHIFTSPGRLRWLFAIPRWTRSLSLVRLLAETDELLSRKSRIRGALELLRSTIPPDLTPHLEPRRFIETVAPKTAELETARRDVHLFAGCVMRELFRHTNRATTAVLMAHGCEVGYARDQVCCGALHAHAGYLDTARRLARQNVDLFNEGNDANPIIVNSAGCGAMLKQYGELLEGDPNYRDRAARFSLRVRDICEFLVEIGFKPGPRALSLKVCYDAPCHLHHGQRIKTPPLQLLRQLRGVDLLPLADAEVCCGGAGIYNLLHPQLANRILERKLERVAKTGADMLVTGNPGCLMQLGSGAAIRGLSITLAHPIELIAASYAQ